MSREKLFLFCGLPQTHGPYHKGNGIHRSTKMPSRSAWHNRC